jgi:hypothetical protein
MCQIFAGQEPGRVEGTAPGTRNGRAKTRKDMRTEHHDDTSFNHAGTITEGPSSPRMAARQGQQGPILGNLSGGGLGLPTRRRAQPAGLGATVGL